ncbi:MAG: peroxiredoxin family protein [Acidobacteriota bacterium]|nr:peroxiredoxin family protein [Acidobacteriota bacterium]
MTQFESVKDEVGKSGAALVFIAAEKRGGLHKPEKYLVEHHISFPFLLDEDRSVTKAYGVYQRLGVDGFNIARPATFVIGPAGVIAYIYVGKSQFDRPPTQDIFNAARKLGGNPPQGD